MLSVGYLPLCYCCHDCDFPGCNSSSSSESDGSSSSSSSSSSSDAAPSEGSVQQAHKRRRSDDASYIWGDAELKMFRITSKITSIQMKCSHPLHQGQGTCTKTRSCLIAGVDVAVRMLKAWAVWGMELPSKAEHRRLWEAVEHAWVGEFLPSESQLDAQVSLIFAWPIHD